MIKLATFGILAFALSLFAVDMAQGQTTTPTATPTPTTSVTTVTPTPTTTVPGGAPSTGFGN